mgnify:CR=1 FL=1
MLLELRRMTAFLQDKEEDFVKLLMSKSMQEAPGAGPSGHVGPK